MQKYTPTSKLNSVNSNTTLESKKPTERSQSKRFVRTKDKSSDSSKLGKVTPKTSSQKSRGPSPKTFETPSYIKSRNVMEFIKSQIDNESPIKRQNHSKRQQTEYKLPQTFRQKWNTILKIQSQVSPESAQQKSYQFLLLEDQNKKLKQKLQHHEQRLFQTKKQLKLQQQKQAQINSQNTVLTLKLSQLEDDYRQIKQKYSQLTQNHDKILEENQDLINYYNKYMEDNIPLQLRELQSYRQVSLQQQINSLKQQLKKSMSQKQQQLQTFIYSLKTTLSTQIERVKSLSICNRVQVKKLQEMDTLSCENLRLKETISSWKKRYSYLQCQNEQLRKSNSVLKNANRRKRLKSNASQDSLNLSNVSS